jgi:hypothetical protein
MTYAFCYDFQLDDPFSILEEETHSFHFFLGLSLFTFLGAWSR